MTDETPPQDSEKKLEFHAKGPDAGVRLDLFLVRKAPELSRALARKMIEAGKVKVNGRRAKKSMRLEPGDNVLLLEAPISREFIPLANPDLAIEVVHEDESLLVVSKPAGIPTHPLRADETGTVCNWLVARFPDTKGVGYSSREPGIIHRLDTHTSGLVVVARTTEAFEKLTEALGAGLFEKEYIAMVDGHYAGGSVIDGYLISRRGKKGMLVSDDEQPRSRYGSLNVLETTVLGDRSTVRVSAAKATRHQVRALLAHAGHPIIGDELYGGPKVADLTRHLLHASRLAFDHPITGDRIEVTSAPDW